MENLNRPAYQNETLLMNEALKRKIEVLQDKMKIPQLDSLLLHITELLVISDLKLSTTGNCLPISELTMLSVPIHQSPEKVINFYFEDPEERNNVHIGHSYVFEAGLLSECTEDIIHYIAGFVAKRTVQFFEVLLLFTDW